MASISRDAWNLREVAMSVLRKPERYSVEGYLASELKADVRHEYVEGHVYAMAGGTRRHNRITMNAGSRLLDAARGGNCEVYQSDMKVRVQNQAGDLPIFYYPDVVVACEPDSDTDELYVRRPRLIVEVLSPSTESTDRREKWFAYRGIPSLFSYALVDSERREVVYFVRSSAGEWETANLEDGEAMHLVCPGLRKGLTLDSLYEGVRW
jgi:Uma2 family endonuclease